MTATRRRLLVAATGLAVLTIAVVSRSRPGDKAPAVVSRDDAREEVALLRARLERLEAASMWQAAALSQQGKSEPPPEERTPLRAADPGPSTQPKQHMPDGHEYAAQLEDKFRTENPDPNWSQKATSDATRALANNLTPGSRLGTVECRSDLCRVETTHDDLTAYQTFMNEVLGSAHEKLWNAGISTQVINMQSKTGLTAITFIAKEGKEMPLAQPIPD
jgi:hypothetical protein